MMQERKKYRIGIRLQKKISDMKHESAQTALM